MLIEAAQGVVLMVHRIAGYPTILVMGPLALAYFARPHVYRRYGAAFLILYLVLYCSGTILALTMQDTSTWPFARNIAFNFFGVCMVLIAYRAILLFRVGGDAGPSRLDWTLAGGLTAGLLVLAAVGILWDPKMVLLSGVGGIIVALEFRDLRRAFRPASLLINRHIRLMLASYYYALTVISIVHLGHELPGAIPWAWPSLIGLPVIYVATASSVSSPGLRHNVRLKLATQLTIAVGLGLGAYLAMEHRDQILRALHHGVGLSMELQSHRASLPPIYRISQGR